MADCFAPYHALARPTRLRAMEVPEALAGKQSRIGSLVSRMWDQEQPHPGRHRL